MKLTYSVHINQYKIQNINNRIKMMKSFFVKESFSFKTVASKLPTFIKINLKNITYV